jgi:periplasmic protein TonB
MKNKLLIFNLFFSLFCISCKNSVEIKVGDIQPEHVCASYYSPLLNKRVYTRMEVEPEFPGGLAKYSRFMNRNVKTTAGKVDADTWQSSVEFNFIIDTDGQIKHARFHGKEDTMFFSPLEKEVYRVIKKMPKWTPGKCNGQVVAAEVKRSMIVSFEKKH